MRRILRSKGSLRPLFGNTNPTPKLAIFPYQTFIYRKVTIGYLGRILPLQAKIGYPPIPALAGAAKSL
ncbi:MAG: hypothetical protein V1735_07070 [Nanoarchaeota archaeon]